MLLVEGGPSQFDLAYVDGSHLRADVLFDGLLAFQLLAVGGVLVFDDYHWDRYTHNAACHPREAVDALLAVMGDKLRLLHKGYQVMVQKVAE